MSQKTAELTDFVYDVLNNTMEAILNARIDQERRYFEMLEDTLLSVEEFVEKYNLEAELTDSLEGEQLEKEDFANVLVNIYQERMRVIGKMLEEGPPKLVVQNGNVKVRLAFTTEELTTSTTSPGARKGKQPFPAEAGPKKGGDDKLKKIAAKSKAMLLTHKKLDKVVRAKQLYRSDLRQIKVVLPGSEEADKDTANMYGEISINFTVRWSNIRYARNAGLSSFLSRLFSPAYFISIGAKI